MPLYAPNFAEWTRISDAGARRECEALARALPQDFTFAGLEAHSYCGAAHRIARFRLQEPGGSSDFVLIPGGTVELGFDGQRFQPSPDQIASYAKTAEEYGLDESIQEFVDSETTAPRRAIVPAMLVETEARELGVEPITADNPIFEELEQHFGAGFGAATGQTRHYGGALDGCIVMREEAGGPLRAWRHRPMTLAAVEREIQSSAMRLLTSDEWEHICGAGAPTLFRWGDVCPIACYPIDVRADDCDPDWELDCKADCKPGAGWSLHSRPNLFGLRIAVNPYELELVADGSRTRGGDGGCNICGGAGFFFGWLPLATAYHNPEMVDEPGPDDDIADDYHRVRRVVSL